MVLHHFQQVLSSQVVQDEKTEYPMTRRFGCVAEENVVFQGTKHSQATSIAPVDIKATLSVLDYDFFVISKHSLKN